MNFEFRIFLFICSLYLVFFEFDQNILQFYGIWDMTAREHGDALRVRLHYHLSDGTIEGIVLCFTLVSHSPFLSTVPIYPMHLSVLLVCLFFPLFSHFKSLSPLLTFPPIPTSILIFRLRISESYQSLKNSSLMFSMYFTMMVLEFISFTDPGSVRRQRSGAEVS